MVTSQGREKLAMLSSRNIWDAGLRCCFTQYLHQWPRKREQVHTEWCLDGVKLCWIVKRCAGERNSRRSSNTEWVKRLQIGFNVDYCKVKHRITCEPWKSKLTVDSFLKSLGQSAAVGSKPLKNKKTNETTRKQTPSGRVPRARQKVVCHSVRNLNLVLSEVSTACSSSLQTQLN